MFTHCPLCRKITKTVASRADTPHSNWGCKLLIVAVIAFACSGFVYTQVDPWTAVDKTYLVFANFDTVAGLREKAAVEIAGIKVGYVERINLTEKGQAQARIRLANNVAVPWDSPVTIRARAADGERYVNITWGEERRPIKTGANFAVTRSEAGTDGLAAAIGVKTSKPGNAEWKNAAKLNINF